MDIPMVNASRPPRTLRRKARHPVGALTEDTEPPSQDKKPGTMPDAENT